MKYLLFFISLIFIADFAQAQTVVKGTVTDEETKEVLIYANVIFEKNGMFFAGASTDFDGIYKVTLDPGTYDIKISYVGYPGRTITGFEVKQSQINTIVNFNLELYQLHWDFPIALPLPSFRYPLIELDNTTSKTIIDKGQIQKYPTKDVQEIILSTPGVSSLNF